MKLLFVFGPPAVGKMTVGHEIEKLTGLKVFHNHMTRDLVVALLGKQDPMTGVLIEELRMVILKAMAKSNVDGVIFTAGLDFAEEGNMEFVDSIEHIFTDVGAKVYYLELESPLETRLDRNKTPHRLEHKPTKRDFAASDQILLDYDKVSRFNTLPGEFPKEHYLKIDNSHLSAEEVAKMVVEKFGL